MTPQKFIETWKGSVLKARSSAQPHFNDLCDLIGEPRPTDVDRTGMDYGFEVGAARSGENRGFADVFKRGHFAWEYKGTHANLDKAWAQLQKYAVALDNPPLLIVSDIGTTIRIHTNWTNTVSETYVIAIDDLVDPVKRGWLKSAFTDPDELRPKKSRQQLTEEVAGEFAELARRLQDKGNDPGEVAGFVNRLIFCMFAESVKLLGNKMFTRMLDRAAQKPGEFERFAGQLFRAMRTGGEVGYDDVAYFNGGLFEDDRTYALDAKEVALVRKAASQYWGDINPSILGTLFERGLDLDKRSELGAHYTSAARVASIVDPVVRRPLTAEWKPIKDQIEASYRTAATARARMPKTQKEARSLYAAARRAEEGARRQAVAPFDGFLVRLREFRVLDPACGSGNFLYSALKAIKDVEHLAIVEMETLSSAYGFPHQVPLPTTGPENVLGIEKSPYAAELARVSIWIGEIQWMLRNGYPASQNPVLKSLDNVALGDALIWKTEEEKQIGTDGSEEMVEPRWVETHWPDAHVLVGNPPFLADRKMRVELGGEYLDGMRSVYGDRVPGRADLVVYWLHRAATRLVGGSAEGIGFVATKAIAKGASRVALDLLVADGRNLGSGLIDQSQKMTVAAMQMAEKKVWAHRS